jgi:phage shock protein E
MKLLTSELLILLFTSFCFAKLTRGDETKADKPTTQPVVKKISVDEFDKMRQEKQAVVLDVRTTREFEAGHVPGAVNIPIASPDFKQQISKLDKSKTYLVHCYRGSRSATATQEMSKMDFMNLYDFSGGMDAYQKAKKPVEK